MLANYEAEELLQLFNLREKQLAEEKAYLRQISSDVIDKIDTLIRINKLIETRRKRSKRGGEVRGQQMQENAKPDHDKIIKHATRLLKEKKQKKDIVGLITIITGFGKKKVYTALEKHPSGNWLKKVS